MDELSSVRAVVRVDLGDSAQPSCTRTALRKRRRGFKKSGALFMGHEESLVASGRRIWSVGPRMSLSGQKGVVP